MPNRRLTLFEKLTWRFSLLSAREWLVITIGVLAFVAYGVFMAGRGGVCSGEHLQMQLAFDRSDRDINALSPTDVAGRCGVYRHRRELLARAADLMGRCGTGHSGRGSFDFLTGRANELSFYESLVEKQCGEAKPLQPE